MRDMGLLGIEQIFTSYNNPKGNADTERMMRTIKEEVIWLNEFSSFEEARHKIGRWIEVDYIGFGSVFDIPYRHGVLMISLHDHSSPTSTHISHNCSSP
jgi:hypothetical protein